MKCLVERVEELDRGLDAANQRTSKQHYALEKRHYALAHRVEKLEKWVDGTDLITSERFCALTERVAELEERLNTLETFADDTAALLKRRTKRHNALVERVGKLEQGQRLEWIRQGRAAGYNISIAKEDKDE